MQGYGETRLASIATCLLLQATILGAGWLLREVRSHQQQPPQGDRTSQSAPGLGAAAEAVVRPQALTAPGPLQPWRWI